MRLFVEGGEPGESFSIEVPAALEPRIGQLYALPDGTFHQRHTHALVASGCDVVMSGGGDPIAHEEDVLQRARSAMAAFRQMFDCELRPDTLAEVYAAKRLGATLVHGNNPGFDALAPNGDRYQIKYRAAKSVIDINNFDFDYIVLVIMDASYSAVSMCKVTQEQARQIFVRREKYGRWQATQPAFLAVAERL